MIKIAGAVLILFLALIFWFFLFPIRLSHRAKESDGLVEPSDFFVYSYALHLHTQFSYDSLGKPEDVMETRDKLGIDYVIVTDHDNDHIGKFADGRLIAGRELKLNDEEGNLLGALLEIGDLKVIVHHFRSKYRWRLEKREDYIFELIDLRDALLERKFMLSFYILVSSLFYFLMRKRVVKNFSKLLDPERYVKRYLEEGWKSKVVGGLDHHVKLYIREVRKRVLIPDYELSMSLLRNFLISDVKVETKEEFLKALKKGLNVISFSEKPSLIWKEGKKIKIYSPFQNTFSVVYRQKGKKEEFLGSGVEVEIPEEDLCIVVGYTYAFRLGRLLFGVRPLFISDILRI